MIGKSISPKLVSLTSYTAEEGETVLINCFSEGDIDKFNVLLWENANGHVNNTQKPIRKPEVSSRYYDALILYFPKFRKTDAGVYTCRRFFKFCEKSSSTQQLIHLKYKGTISYCLAYFVLFLLEKYEISE